MKVIEGSGGVAALSSPVTQGPRRSPPTQNCEPLSSSAAEIPVMKSADQRLRLDHPDLRRLYRPGFRAVLGQSEVRPGCVIVAEILHTDFHGKE